MEKEIYYNIFNFELEGIIPLIQNFNATKPEIKENLSQFTTTDIMHDAKVDHKNRTLVILFGIRIVENETQKKLIDFHYGFHFKLKPQIKYEKEKLEKVNTELLINLIAVSYSTFRGVFAVASNGSPYDNIMPLPIIDPKKLVNIPKEETQEKS